MLLEFELSFRLESLVGHLRLLLSHLLLFEGQLVLLIGLVLLDALLLLLGLGAKGQDLLYLVVLGFVLLLDPVFLQLKEPYPILKDA